MFKEWRAVFVKWKVKIDQLTIPEYLQKTRMDHPHHRPNTRAIIHDTILFQHSIRT